jgi:lipopolysaccharide/colanic/teichoic acid biosynthesis glycosyltransferase
MTRGSHTTNTHQGVTRIGQILRCSGIDQIPQLINVIRGDMSFVGLRPFSTASAAAYRARVAPNHLHNVKPGLVSWAQVKEVAHTADPSLRDIEDDCYYLENRSLLLDVKILFLALFSRGTYS